MNHALHLTLLGAAAGAAGTTALNALTYMDMTARGRPASSTPETTVERLSEVAHVPIPGDEETRENRVAGLGPLTGQLAGVGIGALLGLARAAGWRPAIGVSTAVAGPMTLLGVTDPRTWPATSWVVDLVPHLAYGAVTAAVLERLNPR